MTVGGFRLGFRSGFSVYVCDDFYVNEIYLGWSCFSKNNWREPLTLGDRVERNISELTVDLIYDEGEGRFKKKVRYSIPTKSSLQSTL